VPGSNRFCLGLCRPTGVWCGRNFAASGVEMVRDHRGLGGGRACGRGQFRRGAGDDTRSRSGPCPPARGGLLSAAGFQCSHDGRVELGRGARTGNGVRRIAGADARPRSGPGPCACAGPAILTAGFRSSRRGRAELGSEEVRGKACAEAPEGEDPGAPETGGTARAGCSTSPAVRRGRARRVGRVIPARESTSAHCGLGPGDGSG
jgi:hypothetical protein